MEDIGVVGGRGGTGGGVGADKGDRTMSWGMTAPSLRADRTDREDTADQSDKELFLSGFPPQFLDSYICSASTLRRVLDHVVTVSRQVFEKSRSRSSV